MDNKELYDIICAVHNGNMSQMRAIELIRTHIERLEAGNRILHGSVVDLRELNVEMNQKNVELESTLATYEAVAEKARELDIPALITAIEHATGNIILMGQIALLNELQMELIKAEQALTIRMR